MIYEVEGDILLTEAKAIAHGLAPNDSFDNGLALSLRENWPANAKDFKHYANQTHPKPGEIWVWSGVGGIKIFNLLTQEGSHDHGAKPGRATMPNVNHCLKRLRHELENLKINKIALPKLATGVGGLEWKEVYKSIKSHFDDSNINIYLYTTYHKGQKAEEPS